VDWRVWRGLCWSDWPVFSHANL